MTAAFVHPEACATGSAEDHRYKATGKRSYRTRREADADIAPFRSRMGRQLVRAYQCAACFGFHTTAAARPEPRRR
jgi:hypothetical protein